MVKNGEDMHRVPGEREEHAVWEPVQKRTADATIDPTECTGM